VSTDPGGKQTKRRRKGKKHRPQKNPRKSTMKVKNHKSHFSQALNCSDPKKQREERPARKGEKKSQRGEKSWKEEGGRAEKRITGFQNGEGDY